MKRNSLHVESLERRELLTASLNESFSPASASAEALLVAPRLVQVQQSTQPFQQTVDQDFYFSDQGLRRHYIVHTPPNYRTGEVLPVVLVFHGAGSTASAVRRQTKMNAVADENRFIAVYPEGVGSSNKFYWNVDVRLPTATYPIVNDVQFTSALLDQLAARFTIDSQRVYATGFSAGAMLTHKLGVDLGSRIAAIATVSGPLTNSTHAPQRPIPVLHMHGLEDTFAPYDFRNSKYAIGRIAMHSVPGTIEWWRNMNGAQATPVASQTSEHYTLTRYAPAPGSTGAEVVLVTLPEGGHTWPGGTPVSSIYGNLVTEVDASRMIWQFLSQYRLSSASPLQSPIANSNARLLGTLSFDGLPDEESEQSIAIVAQQEPMEASAHDSTFEHWREAASLVLQHRSSGDRKAPREPSWEVSEIVVQPNDISVTRPLRRQLDSRR
jgi:polyhydroxybutyrate depolymerase